MEFTVGQKVTDKFGNNGEVTKVFKNGKVEIASWVQGGFMRKPELWKTTFKATDLTAR